MDLLRSGGECLADRWLDGVRVPGEGDEGDAAFGAGVEGADLRLALRSLGATRLEHVAALGPQSRDLRLPFPSGIDPEGAPKVGAPPGRDPRSPNRTFSGAALARASDVARRVLDELERWPRRQDVSGHFGNLEALVFGSLCWEPSEATGESWLEALREAVGSVPADFMIERDDFVHILERVSDSAGEIPLGGRGGGVQVLSVMEARARTFSHLFVLGLNRDVFPRPVREDPILGDGIRRAIGELLPDMPVKRRGHDEDRHLFAQLAASAPEVTLSWQSVSDDGKAAARSTFVERLLWQGTGLSIERVGAAVVSPALAPAVRPVFEEALEASLLPGQEPLRHVLAVAIEEGRMRAGLPVSSPSVSAALAAARLATVAELDRSFGAPDLGPFFGFVGNAFVPGDRRREPSWVTALEAMARCPWQAFLARVLRVESVPDRVAQIPDLESHVLGNVVHGTLERIFREVVPRGEAESPAVAGREPFDVPWPSPEHVDRALVQAARSALTRAGLRFSGLVPVAVERARPFVTVASQRGWVEAGQGLAAEFVGEVARYADGPESKRIFFAADRVDRHDGELLLSDYKTGKPLSGADDEAVQRKDLLAAVRSGKALQATAYALVREREGDAGRYLFLGPDVSPQTAMVTVKGADTEVIEAFEETASRLLALRADGAFVPRLISPKGGGEADVCRTCDLAQACLRGDSGARGRLGRWFEAGAAAGDEIDSREALRQLFDPRRAGEVDGERRRFAFEGQAMTSSNQTSPREADSLARERAQTVFDRPLVLEAGAGTGKTSTLVARIVAWCVGEGWTRAEERIAASQRGEPTSIQERRARIAADVLGRVVAITFTDAAAAEMSARVGGGLADLSRGESVLGFREDRLGVPKPEYRARALALVGMLDYLVVCTIHAFCRRLLARHPLECGLHPSFQVDSDQRLQDVVVRETVEAALRAAYREGPGSALFDLVASGQGAARIEEAVLECASRGVTADSLARDPFAPEALSGPIEALSDALLALHAVDEGALSRVEGSASRTRDTRAALERATARVEAFASEVGSGDDRRLRLDAWVESLAALFKPEDLKRIDLWARSEFIKAERDCLGDRADAFAARVQKARPLLRGLVAATPLAFERVRQVLRPILARVEEEVCSRGIVSFDALLVKARNLLRDHSDIAEEVRRNTDQLLVDEFQDTSALQCEIVRLLGLAGKPEDRPGLFLVGDPKQSIYGWRGADLAAYDAFLSEVRAAAGEVESLCVNYRSVPEILEEVSRVIEPVMHECEGLQPAFLPLVVAPELEEQEGFKKGTSAPVEYWVSWRRDPDSGEVDPKLLAAAVAELEAVALAEDLVTQHDQNEVRWSDMAVLLRATSSLDPIVSALKARGVPYAVERDRSYYRRREIIDAAALLRAVIDPSDALAMVTLLRSSAVGVPDAAWIPLWSEGFPDLWSRLHSGTHEGRQALSGLREAVLRVASELLARENEVPGLERIRGWEQSLVGFVEAVARLRESLFADPVDVFVALLRQLTLFEVVESSRYLGLYRRANLDRFFREFAAEWVADSDPQKILRRLRSDVARGREVEEASLPSASVDAVRIMTMHKSKGLDFDHVYLVQLHKDPRGAFGVPVTVHGDPEAPELSLLGSATPWFGTEALRAREVGRAETVRSLYVAMTRAKRRLVLVGQWPAVRKTVSPETATTHMKLLQSRLETPEDLLAKLSQPSGKGADYLDAGEARWLLARGASKSKASSRTPAVRETESPGVEDWRASSQRFLKESRSAEQRMACRLGAPVTALARRQQLEELAQAQHSDPVGGPAQNAPAGTSARPGVAAAAGIAVHRVLEEFDFEPDPREEIDRQIRRVAGWLTGIRDPEVQEQAQARAEAVLQRFREGPLFSRFASLGPKVVARELDVLLSVEPGEDENLGYRSGTVDLLYREPGEGSFVVVDFKTDEVAADATARRAQQYEGQGQAYAQAVKEALELDTLPRVEFWFLSPGVVV